MTGTLLTLGHGYSSTALAELLIPQGWRVMGTTRSADRAGAIAATGVEPVLWQAEPLALALAQADHLLISAAPGPEGDPALALIGLAVIHAVTLGTNLRTLILVTTYVVVILFGFPILLLLLLGLAEGFLNIRARRFGAAPPTI